MLKISHLILALSTALILIVTDITWNPKNLVVANPVADTTGCYMQTSDGRSVDLGNMCRQPQTSATPNTSRLFVVDDQVVSDPDVPLTDPEFSPVGNVVTWQDKKNKLWVASVDPVTGDFIPRSGKGQLLDTDLVPPEQTRNGPEWIYGEEGLEIVYTKFVNNKKSLSRARWTGTAWQTENLDNGSNRRTPIGSQDPDDPAPRILYGSLQGNKYLMAWREINNAASEALVPGANSVMGRWVEGDRSIMLTIDVDGLSQCAKYDVDTGTMTQLTFDAGNKSAVSMWRAPEFNNELVFFCMSDNTSVPVYRKIDTEWTKIHTIIPPSTGPYIKSPEPFVYKGKSYVSLVTMNDLNRSGLTDVWIAGIDPTVSFYQKVSDSTERDRRDPESFITASGAFIYYTEQTQDQRMIHRCETGLGPPQ